MDSEISDEGRAAEVASSAHGWRAALGLAVALAVGLAARLAAWRIVMTERGVRLAFDGDPYYHVLQAERLLSGRSVWLDPSFNWPDGQGVLWPPLFDALIAGAARLAFGPGASRPELELAAALLPVPLGLLTIALVFVLGWLLLGRGHAVASAFLVAVLPAAVLWSSVGAADQHVLEILLSCAVVAAFVAGWRAESPGRRRSAALLLAVATAASFWNWQGSALNLALPVLFTAAAHVLLPGDAVGERASRTLALGLGLAAALLAATVVPFGPPGALARGELAGVTGLHVAMTAGAAAFGGLLVLARALRGGPAGAGRRIVEVALALLLPAGALLGAAPAVRGGVLHGVTALAAANPWYPEIAEYRHLVFSCIYPLSDDLRMFFGTYGLTIAAALLAVPPLVRRARGDDPAGRASVLFLAAWAVPLLGLALVRRRFAPYLTIPLALLTSVGLGWLAAAVSGRLAGGRRAVSVAVAAVAAILVLAPTKPALTDGVTVPDEGDVAALQWLGTQPSVPAREGVLATWDLGHYVRYYAGKPALASPFGTDASVAAMTDTARFDLATDPSAAAELLRRRRIGFVVLSDPMPVAIVDQGFVPANVPLVTAVCSASAGRSYAFSPDFFDTIAARLFYYDGRAAPGRRVLPIDTQRLVYESGPKRMKIFAVAEGAELRVRGAPPVAEVAASVFLRTNTGRATAWSASAVTDARGVATLRVPYATGMNGAVQASAVLVVLGAKTVSVTLSEADVSSGARVEVSP